MTKKQLALKYTRQCAYQKENADRIKARKLRKRINDPAKYMLDTKRRTCKVIGVEFSLSASDITPLPSVCPVLGIKLDYAICSGKKRAKRQLSFYRSYPSASRLCVGQCANYICTSKSHQD